MNSSALNFNRAEKLAKELRLLQSTSNLALDVLCMEFDRSIYFETFEYYSMVSNIPLSDLTMGYTLSDGYTVRLKGGINLILYHEKNRGKPRLNWTLAHEIGHIYSNHNEDGAIQEIEANQFAAELLMPTPIVTKLARKISLTPKIIAKTFFVSEDAAVRKVGSLRRGGVGSSYLVKEVLDKYEQPLSNLIECYKNQQWKIEQIENKHHSNEFQSVQK